MLYSRWTPGEVLEELNDVWRFYSVGSSDHADSRTDYKIASIKDTSNMQLFDTLFYNWLIFA